MKTFDICIKGFQTEKQAHEFLTWYINSGEQAFYDHLEIIGLNPDDGCNIKCNRKGNYKNSLDKKGNVLIAHLE